MLEENISKEFKSEEKTCKFGCGREGKYIIQPHNKLCCEDNISKCPAVLSKIKEKLPCYKCGKLFGKTVLKKHENVCGEYFCKNCGVEIYNNRNIFCSHKCAVQYRFITDPDSFRKNEKRFCRNCNKELTSNQFKYCSLQCQSDFQVNGKIQKWLKKEEYQICTTGTLNTFIRNYLLRQANYKCTKCGWGEKNLYTNSIPLEVHHIDGNWQNQEVENLIVLCPNCHSLENYYTSNNKNINKHKNRNNYQLKKRKSQYLSE